MIDRDTSATRRLKVLQSFANTSHTDTWSPFPEGYTIGTTKYVIVTGGVISGVGKGITGGSVGMILQEEYGFVCNPIKLESYYNIDSGLLSPFEHGEVFVLDDGTETDMDLGSYESFYSKDLSRWNFFTNGTLEESLRALERDGSFQGSTVQFYPHKVGLVNRFIRQSAMETDADITIVEVGGKVGDEESRVYFKALERLMYEEGRENIFIIHNVYMARPEHLREQKTWPVQQAIQDLAELIISRPDLVVVRSRDPMETGIRRKIEDRCMLQEQSVISLPDQKSIYTVPAVLKANRVHERAVETLGLDRKSSSVNVFSRRPNEENLRRWQEYNAAFAAPKRTVTIGITGKYGEGNRDVYASIIKAVEHAGTARGVFGEIRLIDVDRLESGEKGVDETLSEMDGIIIPGGFGRRGTEGKILCARYARERKVPYLGLCYGFQMAIVEFGRNVCGLECANTEENFPQLEHPVICLLPEQYEKEGLGGNMRLGGKDVYIVPGTRVHEIFGRELVRFRFRHRYEFNPAYQELYEKHGMVFSGMTQDRAIMQILELPEHPFFIGTQAHPEFTSRPLSPHPMYLAFIDAVAERMAK